MPHTLFQSYQLLTFFIFKTMLSYQQAQHLSLTPLPENILTKNSFGDNLPLWNKCKHQAIPSHILNTSKRYLFSKLGKVLGLSVTRYISLYQHYLFYYQQPSGGQYKGYCDLTNRYVQFHTTTSTKQYLFILSNKTETCMFYFQDMGFWEEWKDQIVQYTIRTNYLQQYKEENILGEGSFSTVVAVSSRNDGQMYAAKKIPKVDINKKMTKGIVLQQRKILQILRNCKQVSRFVEFYQQNDEYIIILSYLQGKNLSEYLRQNKDSSYQTVKKILGSILSTLSLLHSNNILHRDIKPQNIVIDNELNCYLIDFGLSLIWDEAHQKSKFGKCGTVGYMAPQVITSKRIHPYNHKCDLFSFGIVAHILLMGNNPLKGKNYFQTYDLNLQCKIILNKHKIISKYGVEGLEFLDKLLEVNPEYRYSANQALSSLFLNGEQKEDCNLSNSTTEGRKLSEYQL